jgi:two-component system, NtrC family, response regulator HydG
MNNVPELNEAFRQALLETIPCAVVLLDAQRRIVYWNPAAEELTGYPAGEMLGQSCDTIGVQLARRQDREVIEAMCPFREQADGAYEQCSILRKDGSELPVVRIARPVLDAGGQFIGAIQAIVDVSVIERSTQEIRRLRREVARTGRYGQIIGASEPMRSLFERMELVADTDASVVIEGETGTGKELVARTIHAQGARGKGPFVAVHCAALPQTLLEAELFGHVRGAFTGADRDREGLFEAAHGGTLFLDEVGDLALPAQAKLLRALEEREIVRLGATRSRPVDVRVIAATHQPLDRLAAQGTFREDLLYRLRVITLELPPLRDRRSDIPALVAHFLAVFAPRHERRISGFTDAARRALLAYDWPGNVRELRNVVERAVVLAERTTIEPDDLPGQITGSATPLRPTDAALAELPFADARARALESFDRSFLAAALERHGGNVSRTARALNLHRQSLQKLLRRLGLTMEARD